MTKPVAPTLDDLLMSDNPAWLWDGERTRIVWANGAGSKWFGAETLFDLLDMVFDPQEKSVARINELSASLPRGESIAVSLQFASAKAAGNLLCNCYVHALADGRSGLLVCGKAPKTGVDALPAAMQAIALGAIPLALCVADGSGKVVFANEAMTAMFATLEKVSFAKQQIKASFASGTVSAVINIATRHGDRDVRVITRCLEKSDRLADASFLLVLEDITERRSLERSLMDAASGELDDEPVTIANRKPADVAQTLATLKNEIENKTADIPAAPAPVARPAAKPVVAADVEPAAKPVDDSVPEIVSATLNKLPQPLVLINQQGELLFANDVTVELMGVSSWRALDEYTTLSDTLAALEGEDGNISLFSAKDEPLLLDVMISTFPWKDGPVWQATLSPADDGEKADNRRKPDSKKNSEIAPSLALAATPDNVVSIKVEPDSCAPQDNELRAILDTATDGIITLDRDGRICSFNAGAEALFGFEASEVSGKRFAKLLSGDSRNVLDDYLAALSGNSLASVFNDGREVRAKVKQGGEIILFLSIGKLADSSDQTSGNGKACFCVVVRDITQWKKTELDLRKSKERAEKSNAQKSMFLANISHELRTPLNAIMGFSEVMRSQRFGEIENEKYLAYANDIHSSGEYLLALINDLLDLSKVEAGKLELDFTSVNLLNIIDEAMHSLGDMATDNRVLLRKAVSGAIPNVVADIRSMKQIMLNLLSNAVKFTSPGGQVISSVKLNDAGELLLSIKDTGRGMDAEQLQKALAPFQRVEQSGDDKMPGTGLGLPLTKALVEANRAKFEITSAPKKGTLIEIVFPTTRVLAE